MTEQIVATPTAIDVPTPPRTVNVAFWFFIAAAVTYIPAFFVALALIGPARNKLISQGFSASRATSAMHLAIGVLVVGVVLGIVLLGIMAVLFRGGAGWARTILIVLTALTLLGLIRSFTSGYGLDALHAVLMVIGTIYALRPSSSRYLSSVKAAVKGGRLS